MPPGLTPTSVQFSPDGRTVGVTVFGLPGNLWRFDARTGRRAGPPIPVNDPGRLTFDPVQSWPRTPALLMRDPGRVVAGSPDGVLVRDTATLRILRRFPATALHAIGTTPSAYALSPDDRTLAIGSEDGSLRLLDLRTGRLRTALGRHRGPVNEARFTPDARTLVTTGEDGDVIVWDVRHAAAAETLSGHARSAFSPAIADNGTTLYTASLDGTVMIWDLVGRRRLGRRFRSGTGVSFRYALSSDGRLLAQGEANGKISLVDMRTLALHRPFPVVRGSGVEGPGRAEGIAFVPGSHLLVVGGTYGSVALVDADRGVTIKQLIGHRPQYRSRGTITGNAVTTPSVTADGSLLATASKDGDVRLWSLPDGRPRGPPLRFAFGNTDAQLSPDGRWLSVVPLTRDAVPDRLEIWDVRRRQRIHTYRPAGGVSTAQFSSDGRRLAVTDLHGRVQVLATATWKPVTAPLAADGDGWVAFTHNGDTLAIGSDDGTVRLWDVASGQPLAPPLPGIANTPAVPIFTPGDTHLIAALAAGRAYRWDIRPASLTRQACTIAGRHLTRDEWDEFLPGKPYAPAC
jgi:WD40 repeat protein